ncbi:unnamed protein product [Cylicocyclus nassatus]|uniref:Uncharacterized protein n=1 Tax=Cylicocyclus nassatus TaxID=53992 RepID=A0AA36GMH8_CYLNA|nr:unnamed protein product [Cylicocyclus nassatus]
MVSTRWIGGEVLLADYEQEILLTLRYSRDRLLGAIRFGYPSAMPDNLLTLTAGRFSIAL